MLTKGSEFKNTTCTIECLRCYNLDSGCVILQAEVEILQDLGFYKWIFICGRFNRPNKEF